MKRLLVGKVTAQSLFAKDTSGLREWPVLGVLVEVMRASRACVSQLLGVLCVTKLAQAGHLILSEGRTGRGIRLMNLANQFSSVAWNYVQEAYEAETMFPMDNQKSCCLVI
jgi:hypothetical protein